LTVNYDDYVWVELENVLNRLNQECSDVLPLNKVPIDDDISMLFRSFHSLKSNCLYIDFDSIASWAVVVEDTLSKLRNGLSCSNEIINWLNNLLDQINLWQAQIQTGEKQLEFLNIFKKLPDWLDTDTELIYDMNILYVGLNMNLEKILGYKFTKFTASHNIDIIESYIKNEVDIIIIDYQAGYDIIEKIEALIDPTRTAVLAVSHQPTNVFHIIPKEFIFNPKKEKLGAIFKYIVKAVTSNENIIKRFTRKQNLKIKYIEYLVSNVTAMPDSINKIKKIIQNPHFEMPDLIEVVRKDPIATALLIKEAKNPYYNISQSENMKIQNIVTLFGPKLVYTTLVQKMLNKTMINDLSPYNLKVEQFIKIAMRRSVIVEQWIKKNGYKELDNLTLMIYFAPIGQYILSEDLVFTGKEDIFTNLIEDKTIQISQAEKQIVGYTTPQLSAVLLENWGFEQDMCFPLLKMGGFEHGVRAPEMKKFIVVLNYLFDRINQCGIDDLVNTHMDYELEFEELGLDLESLDALI
jgi:HD-like signal output (HDOD) protein